MSNYEITTENHLRSTTMAVVQRDNGEELVVEWLYDGNARITINGGEDNGGSLILTRSVAKKFFRLLDGSRTHVRCDVRRCKHNQHGTCQQSVISIEDGDCVELKYDR